MYFITAKNSETGKKFKVISDRAEAIRKQQIALADEIGFDEWRKGLWCIYGGFTSLIFKNKPNPKIYKEVHFNEYMPKLNTKIGKEIQNKLDSCDKISKNELNKCVGYDNKFNNIGFDHNNALFFGFSIKPGWDVKIPEDCKEVTFSEYKELFKK